MYRPVASIDRDGDSLAGTRITLNHTEATQVSLSIDGYPIAGVEFDEHGVGTIGWYPPDQPDTWEILGRFTPDPPASVTDVTEPGP